MSLRVRLLMVIAILMAAYGVAAIVIVSTQRSLLIDQIDRQLKALPPLGPVGGDQRSSVQTKTGGESIFVEAENPFSDIFIGLVDTEGNVSTVSAGALLDSSPDLSRAVVATNGQPGIVTIGALNATSRFRAIVTPQPGLNTWLVSAKSLEETDAAIARLTRTLWVAGAVIALVLGVAFFWVERLGLRPIARVTAAAEAITAGDRGHRVEVRDERTEAGKLGQAFNLMLDERDLTETRLRQFVADASHELRTPLTSIRGYLELYRQDAFPEKSQMDDVVRRLSAESARMYGLVEDLLALASLDEGRPLRHDEIDLGQVLRDAAQDAQAVQTARTITVVSPDAGPKVTGDSSLIVQLVGIFVSNALAHTPVSAPVTLTATQESTQAAISIADEGPGLEAAAASRVFDRFWRSHASRVRTKRGGQGGGAGLGLSIARSIVEAHGGTIALDTAPGEGCTFTIWLPLEQPA